MAPFGSTRSPSTPTRHPDQLSTRLSVRARRWLSSSIVTTSKRERQKTNRAAKVAAEEAAAKTQHTRSRIITYGIIGAVGVVVVVGLSLLTGNDSKTDVADVPTTALAFDPTETISPSDVPAPTTTLAFEYGTGDCPAEDGSSPRQIDFDGPQPLCIDPAASYTAVFDTTEGEVRLDLATADAPGTVNNFVTLARWGYYNNTTLFRTDTSIDIIQGGSPHSESASDPGPGYQINDEPTFTTDAATGGLVGPYSYSPGQLVMARSAGPNSASAQFFFTTGPNAAALNGQGTYVVLGNTDDAGLGVLQGIIGLHVADPASGLGGAPSRTVTINSVTIEQT